MTEKRSTQGPKGQPDQKRTRRSVQAGIGDGSRPLYKEVKLSLTQMLSGGEYKAGQAIPTEKQLGDRYGVSVGTIRKAIDELVKERVLIRQQGRGTFLADYGPERMLNSFWHIVRKDGVRTIPIVQTLKYDDAAASPEIATALGIAAGDNIVQITNLEILDGEPVVVDEISIARSVFPNLTEDAFLSRGTTIYGFYQNAFDIHIVKTFDRLRAVPADRDLAKLLGVALGVSVLQIFRVAYSFDAKPIEARRSFMVTDKYEYWNAYSSS